MNGIYVERFLEHKIRKYLGDREITAIVGARQCGKTTLMRHMFDGLKKAEFISFEDRDILDMFTKNIKEFIARYVEGNRYLFIDEFQYAKQGGKGLKFIYDTCKTKIIISGSSTAELSIQSIKYLVGRVLVFTLFPFSFEEFLKHREEKLHDILFHKSAHGTSETSNRMIRRLYDEYLIYGGYPRVVLEKDNGKKQELLRNIYNTYLLREIKEILQITEDQKINRLIKALALQVCGIVNYNEVSSITGIEFHQLKKYMNILEKTFVVLESRPFFRNKRRELVKAPKLYFLDNGFRNIAINNFQGIEHRTDKGAINENFVASEISKMGYELRYWRTKSGAEVDFVIEKNGKLIPIEVKSNLKATKLTRSFNSFLDKYRPGRGLVLSESLMGAKKGIRFRPIFYVSKGI